MEIREKDLKAGEIYKYSYDDGDYDIFRATEDLIGCNAITIWIKYNEYTYDESETYFDMNNNFTIPTQEEILWFEYCELHGEYRSKEEALDYMYTKQFVEQYLTE